MPHRDLPLRKIIRWSLATWLGSQGESVLKEEEASIFETNLVGNNGSFNYGVSVLNQGLAKSCAFRWFDRRFHISR